MSDYFLDFGGKTSGPFTIEEVKKLYRAGNVSDETIFSRPGASDWLPLKTIRALLVEDRISVPPIMAASASRIPESQEWFAASRWTSKNLFFPTFIQVGSKSVKRLKKTFFGSNEMSVSINKVASVHIKTGFFFSNIIIESSGGTDPLVSEGHYNRDAERIKKLIENYQESL